jgi:hypothetical protein
MKTVADTNTRWPTSVFTECSIRSGSRRSTKQTAKRSTSPSARSVDPSNKAPASEVMAPPSKPATTLWPSTGSKSNSSVLHSVGIEGLLRDSLTLCCKRIFADS